MPWRVLSLLFFGVFLLLGAGAPEVSTGKEELAVIEIPASGLEKMLKAKSEGLFTEGWTGPELQLDAAKSPYHVNFEYEGVGTGSGDGRNVFAVAWNLAPRKEGSDGELDGSGGGVGGPLQQVRFGGPEMAQGKVVQNVKSLPPLTLKSDQTLQLVVALTERELMQPTRIKLHVWSGFPDPGWRQILGSFRLLWIGLIVAVLVSWQRKRA